MAGKKTSQAEATSMHVVYPIFFCVLSAAIFFAVFGSEIRPKWWQFRLRSLVILVTGASVVFALIRYFGLNTFAALALCLALLVGLVAFLVASYRFFSDY